MPYDDWRNRHPDIFSKPIDGDTFISTPNWSSADIFDNLQIGGRNPHEISPLLGYDNSSPGQPSIIPSTGAQNVAADPGFFGSAAGQQLLLKGGLMILGMVTEATNKPEQSTKKLDKKKVEKIRKKKKKKYGLA